MRKTLVVLLGAALLMGCAMFEKPYVEIEKNVYVFLAKGYRWEQHEIGRANFYHVNYIQSWERGGVSLKEVLDDATSSTRPIYEMSMLIETGEGKFFVNPIPSTADYTYLLCEVDPWYWGVHREEMAQYFKGLVQRGDFPRYIKVEVKSSNDNATVYFSATLYYKKFSKAP